MTIGVPQKKNIVHRVRVCHGGPVALKVPELLGINATGVSVTVPFLILFVGDDVKDGRHFLLF